MTLKNKIVFSRGYVSVGSREVELPPDAVISVTRGEGFPLWPYVLNTVGNMFVIPQVARKPGLLYAEMMGIPEKRGGQTISVWRGKDMVPFRDSGAHRFVMRYLGWTFFSAQTHSYFLTWKANGRIPTMAEAEQIVKAHGKHLVGGKLVRQMSRPVWPMEQAVSEAAN